MIMTVVKFLLVMGFRFFSGKPMHGQKIDNSSFSKGATKGKPGRPTLSRWQRKPWFHRSLIRQVYFWPACLLCALAIINVQYVFLVLLALSPVIAILGYRKIRFALFDPFMSTNADGVRTQHWILKSKWRNLFRRQERKGVVTRANQIDPNLPPELADAVKATLYAELHGSDLPVTNVTRYRRKR